MDFPHLNRSATGPIIRPVRIGFNPFPNEAIQDTGINALILDKPPKHLKGALNLSLSLASLMFRLRVPSYNIPNRALQISIRPVLKFSVEYSLKNPFPDVGFDLGLVKLGDELCLDCFEQGGKVQSASGSLGEGFLGLFGL